MPFYSFYCSKCDETKDYLVPYGTESTACKTCGQQTEKKPSYKFAAHGLPNGHFINRGRGGNTNES